MQNSHAGNLPRISRFLTRAAKTQQGGALKNRQRKAECVEYTYIYSAV